MLCYLSLSERLLVGRSVHAWTTAESARPGRRDGLRISLNQKVAASHAGMALLYTNPLVRVASSGEPVALKSLGYEVRGRQNAASRVSDRTVECLLSRYNDWQHVTQRGHIPFRFVWLA